jgi:hypothetical protein
VREAVLLTSTSIPKEGRHDRHDHPQGRDTPGRRSRASARGHRHRGAKLWITGANVVNGSLTGIE